MAVPGVALTRGFYPLHPTLPPYVVPCEEWERDTGWGNETVGGGGCIGLVFRRSGLIPSLHPCNQFTSGLQSPHLLNGDYCLRQPPLLQRQ